MLKGITVQAKRLNGRHNLSLTLDDVQGITEFGLSLGCQIHKADKVNTGKLIAECIFGGILFGCFFALLAVNCANKIASRDNTLKAPASD